MDIFPSLISLISSQSPSSTPSSILASLGSPSVSISILDHGHITSKCISSIPSHNEETLFQACSISKPITGLATMRLIQAGKLSLDSKITEFLPADILQVLESQNPRNLLEKITIRHLLNHTSGFMIPHFSGYANPETSPDIKTILRGAAPANTLGVKIRGIPGYAMSYSGGGMVILQIILENITKKDFGSLMHELVFEPLGMNRSCYALEKGEKNVAEAYRTGYTPCDNKWNDVPEKAAAGLWTTPVDLLKAVKAVQRSLREGGFLEREVVREMLKEGKGGMALTWIAPRDGVAFAHSGSNDPGWECFVMGYADLKGLGNSGEGKERGLMKEEGCGICIMTNSAAGVNVWAKVFHAITYLKKWVSLPDIPGGGPFGKIPLCVYGEEVDERWVDWEGSWREGENGELLILERSEGGEPVLQFGEDVRVRLVPAAIPSVKYEGGRESIDLVLEGLEMMVRLGWKDRNRDVEVWYDGLPPRCLHLSRVE